MALNFKFDDFKKAAKKAGLENGFSDADLALARQNPNAGMQILQFKIDYGNATTDAQRQAANRGAEGVRLQYGNYYGGVTGDDYYAAPNSIPTPTGNDASATSFGYSDYTKNSPYAAAAQTALQNLLNVQPFSYDKDTDPLYNAYRKQYLREGQRATADTLGQAAANTGGIASSYAVNAANQAGNYYNSQLNDKLVDLYNAAYNRYTFDVQNKYNQFNAVNAADQNEYDRWLGDRNMAYQREQDQAAAQSAADQLAWEREQYERNQAFTAEQNALNRQNSLAEVYANNASRERINTQDNQYALAMQNAKSGGSGEAAGYSGAIKEGVYNDYKAAYPNGAIDNLNAYASLVNQYGLTAVKAAGFYAADSIFNNIRTLGDAEDVLEALGIKATLLTEKDWNKAKRKGTQTEESYEDYLQYNIYRLTN